MSDSSKKFKKLIQIFVPATDLENNLILEPGTKGFVIVHINKEKIGVNIKDLEEALVEVKVMHDLYYPDTKKTEEAGDLITNLPTGLEIGYSDEDFGIEK